MSMDMLKKSAENRKKLIPADFDSRIDSLLASLPDEVPVSESTEAEVIKRTGHFDIRPLVSAAAVFAIAVTGIWAAGSGVHRSFGRSHGNDKKYVTTSEACETTAVTTTADETTLTETEEAVPEISVTVPEEESSILPVTEKNDNTADHGIIPGAQSSAEEQKPEHGEVTPPVNPELPSPQDEPVHPENPSLPEGPVRPDEPSHPEEHQPPEVPSEVPEHPDHPEHPVQGNEKEPAVKPAKPEVPVQVHTVQPEHPVNKTDKDKGNVNEPEHIHPDLEHKKD